MRSSITAAGIAVALLMVTLPLSAQRPVARSVFVEVAGADDRLLTDLGIADLDVTESGIARKILRVTPGTTPMRIVLMVDSSNAVVPMINTFKSALGTFVDALPPTHEVALISSGGQLRVRMPPSLDRDKLRAEAARFAPEGGANAFLDTLLESDSRFLKAAPAFWPVFVIVTTDNGENTREPNIPNYNAFMTDFRSRGGTVHVVLVQGKKTGPVSAFVTNLADNVHGSLSVINTDNSLPAKLQTIAEQLADDHLKMRGRYEVAFEGDPKVVQPVVAVSVNREGAKVLMSVRRPF